MSTKQTYQIRQITSRETFSVRHPVLREGRPIEDCIFEDDDLETTYHFGLFLGESLVGVATFLSNKNSTFKENTQYQLRGMAVLQSHQNLGLGDAILKNGEQFLISKNIDMLWFNAREIAVNFYKKNNYQIIGKSFKIKGVGIHYVMYKRL